MKKDRKIYNLRIEKEVIDECKKVAHGPDSVYDSVSQLIRKFVNDGLKKIKP